MLGLNTDKLIPDNTQKVAQDWQKREICLSTYEARSEMRDRNRPGICLSTTSEIHTVNQVSTTDKTIHNQLDAMFPHLIRANYYQITLSQ